MSTFDFLDFGNIRDDNYLEGNYYALMPEKPSDFPVYFTYSMIDPLSWEYGKIMDNLRLDPSRTAIRTNEDCGWKIGGFICTQDGRFWGIEGIAEEVQSDRNKESLRVVKRAVDTNFVLRLVKHENPWDLK